MENKKFKKIISILIDFRSDVLHDWIYRDHIEQFHNKSYRDIETYAKKIMEVINGSS